MECDRLKKLIKTWYFHVQEETMAPARMVDFMKSHIIDCDICLGDPGVDIEVDRITEIILPPSKIPKAVKREEEQEKAAAREKEEEQEVKEEVETHPDTDEEEDDDYGDNDDDDI